MESVGWNHSRTSQFKIEIVQHPQSVSLNAPKLERITPMLSLTQSTSTDDNENEGSVSSSGDSFNLPDTSLRCFCMASLVSTEPNKSKGKGRAVPMVEQSLSREVGGQENLPLQGDTISSLYHLVKRSCFVFPDLQIPIIGDYRLQFSLYEILKEGTHFVTSILSDEFTISQPIHTIAQPDISSSFPSQSLRDHIRQGSRISSSSEKKITPPFPPSIVPPPFRNHYTYPSQPSTSNYISTTSRIGRKRSIVDLADLEPLTRQESKRSTSEFTEVSGSDSRYLHPQRTPNFGHREYENNRDIYQPNYNYPVQHFVGTSSISPLMQAHQPYANYTVTSPTGRLDPTYSNRIPNPAPFYLGPPFLPLPPQLPRLPAPPELIAQPLSSLQYSPSSSLSNDSNRYQPQVYPLSVPARTEYQIRDVEKLTEVREEQIAERFDADVLVPGLKLDDSIDSRAGNRSIESEPQSSGKGDLKFLLGETLNIESKEEDLHGFFCE